MRRLVCALPLVGVTGCFAPSVFICEDDTNCVDQGIQGICQDTRFCAFPSSRECDTLRYDEFAGDGLAGECVEPDPPDGTDTSSSTSVSSMGSSSMGSSSTGSSSTGTSTTSTSSTGTGDTERPPGPCTPLFEDDFDDGVLSQPPWEIWGNAGSTPVEADGQLTLSIGPVAPRISGILRPIESLVGHSVVFELGTLPQDPVVYSNVEVSGAEKREFSVVAGNLQIRFGPPQNPTLVADVAYDPAAHKFLRIAETGGDVEFAASSNGVDWVALYVEAGASLEQSQNVSFATGTIATTEGPHFASLHSVRACVRP